MELKEAELLQKIKRTQNQQLAEFNKLEEVMFQQQFSAQQRVAPSEGDVSVYQGIDSQTPHQRTVAK